MTFCSWRFWIGPSSVLVLFLFLPGDLSLVHPEFFILGVHLVLGGASVLDARMGGVSLSVVLRA